jgi:hypothetical protein
MRLREPFVKRHICTWKLVQDQRHYAVAERIVIRECLECWQRQTAIIRKDSEADATPDSLVHLADADWRTV